MGLNFYGIRFTEVKTQIESFLKREYAKANTLFGVASPYGQILYVLENLNQLSMLYLRNTISNLELGTANTLNERVVRNASIVAGHIPTRAISASGTLVVSVKPGTDLENEVSGSRMTLINKSRLQNLSNGLDYSLDLGNESVTHLLKPGYRFFVNVVQGYYDEAVFTGDGRPLQSYVIAEPAGRNIDNFKVEVYVNGALWEMKRHLYDMIPDEAACVVRSGFDSGVDLVFGNGSFGQIPPIGAVIRVVYLVNNGSDGNLFRRARNDWNMVDTVIDGLGNSLDFRKLFNIDYYTDISFGADGEELAFTRQMLPMVTNNAVLALPQHFAYEIKKLGVFSHVNAYEKTGTVFITVTPNINLFKNPTANYFSVDKEAFVLDSYERQKIGRYLRGNGLIQLTRKFKVVTPKLSYFAINVHVISYSDATDDSVNAQILGIISNFFLNMNAMNRIPKAQMVSLLSNIPDIHSVDVFFVCKKNEDYHRSGMKAASALSSQYEASATYDPTRVIGIDPVMGDMLFEPDELPIIRGDWQDRNGSYYSDDINSAGLKAVNIIKQGTTDVRFKNM